MARSCESFCCKKNKYCNVFVSTFTTTNQREAREKNHGYGLENNQSVRSAGKKSWLRFRKQTVRSAVRRRIQTLGRAGMRKSFTKCGKTHKQWDEQEGMYQVLEEGKTGIRAINKKLGNVCN